MSRYPTAERRHHKHKGPLTDKAGEAEWATVLRHSAICDAARFQGETRHSISLYVSRRLLPTTRLEQKLCIALYRGLDKFGTPSG